MKWVTVVNMVMMRMMTVLMKVAVVMIEKMVYKSL